MGSDYKQRKYYCTLASSWGRNATFNFAALDMMFPDIKGTEHKIRVALNRIRYPEKLSNAQRDEYIAYLVRCAKDLITRCIDCGDMETLLFCEPFGVIKKSNIENMLDYAVRKMPFNSPRICRNTKRFISKISYRPCRRKSKIGASAKRRQRIKSDGTKAAT